MKLTKYQRFLERYERDLKNNLTEIWRDDNKFHLESYKNLFHLLCLAPPQYSLTWIFKENILLRRLQNTLSRIHDITIDMTPRYVAKAIKSEYDEPELKIDLFLATRGILGHHSIQTKNYGDGYGSFRWCLKLIYYLEKYHIEGDYRLFERNLSLQCARCVIMDFHQQNFNRFTYQPFKTNLNEVHILQGILYGVIKSTDDQSMRFNSKRRKYKLSIFFQSLADIQMSLCLFRSEFIMYETYSKNIRFGLIMNRVSLNDAINKYILAMTTKLEGDEQIVYCNKKIIQGIVLYGQLNINILNFFLELYDYFSLQFTKVYQTNDELLIECLDFAKSTIREWRLNEEPNKTLLLPMLLMESVHGPIFGVEKTDKLLKVHNHEIGKMVGNLKLHAKNKWYQHHRKNQYDLTKDKKYADLIRCIKWISYWKECYIEHHHRIDKYLINRCDTIVSSLTAINNDNKQTN